MGKIKNTHIGLSTDYLGGMHLPGKVHSALLQYLIRRNGIQFWHQENPIVFSNEYPLQGFSVFLHLRSTNPALKTSVPIELQGEENPTPERKRLRKLNSPSLVKFFPGSQKMKGDSP